MYTFCLLNENNKVVDTFVTNEYDLEVAGHIHNQFYSNFVLFDCEKNGIIGSKDQIWNGSKFLPVAPFENWIWNEEISSYSPPVIKPEETEKGEIWTWNQETNSWIDINPKNIIIE